MAALATMQFFRWGAVESRTDHSIDDEPAGKERARQAAASEAMRHATPFPRDKKKKKKKKSKKKARPRAKVRV